VEYVFNNENIGYGAAHNIAIKKSINLNAQYHLVLNPDVYFKNDVLNCLYKYMEANQDVGNIMPKVIYPDGSLQYLAKLLPSPVDLFLRRLVKNKNWIKNRENRYMLKSTGYKYSMNVPNLSGCFMFLRTEALINIGVFDESIFMYLEDIDLNRRIHEKYKTIFYPEVEIIHEYAKESYTNNRLLAYHVKSAIYYFNKWGWFFDKDRVRINSDCLNKAGRNK
jgi:GT2 family glycosyltransferase